MKEKIIMLIIGILIGAIITAGGFLLLGKHKKEGEMPERPNMENRIDGQGGGPRQEEGNRMIPPGETQDSSSNTNI